ncbi:MAG TPA: [FeFe] hydrogenase, group A, partial [Oscillospiraceae bacterium]|nr:[FeFe] hydrogenase, group A [Oscillospiraceae bacterium]
VHMVRDDSKCILCRRCISACEKVQDIGVIGLVNRGFDTHVGTAFDRPLGDVSCVSCGQCIVACPTGALHEKDQTDEVFAALSDPEKFVVIFPAPSIRATLGECFDMPIGTDVTGKMATSMRRLGFDRVFDTNFSADLTIVEEAHELIDRVSNGGTLPLITSCSPGWIKFCEHYYPEMIPNLSSCKSPQQMFGAIVKTYYAEKNNIDPKNIVCVSVMPCTAKKFEVGRPDQDAAGVPDVDIALTTREYARMVKLAGIDFVNLPDGDFDHPLGSSTGAAVIFGATGGVMEAALRTAVSTLTGKEDDNMVVFNEVRGADGVKTATYKVAGMDIKVGVASGTGNARKLLERVKAGEQFHFIEIMCCPGGCINGGGQPQQSAEVRSWTDLIGLRSAALYKNDANKAIRRSHQNPDIIQLYKEYLEKPGSHKAHEILHTTYIARKKF